MDLFLPLTELSKKFKEGKNYKANSSCFASQMAGLMCMDEKNVPTSRKVLFSFQTCCPVGTAWPGFFQKTN